MEPNHNNYLPPSELPNPQDPQLVPEQSGGASPETRGMQMPHPAGNASQPMQAVPNLPVPNPVAAAPIGGSAQQPQQSSAALIADDADLIEKEWVTRAKAIVMQTRDDPHKQNTEMNKVKADYIKKRYNKDLKVNET